MTKLRIENGPDSWPLPSLDYSLVLNETALLIIDMQYCYTHPSFGVGCAVEKMSPGYGDFFYKRVNERVIPNIKNLLERWRLYVQHTIFITLGSLKPDGSDLTPIARERSESRRKITGYPTIFPITSKEYKVREEIKPQNNDIVLIKSTMGAFASTNIDSILRSLGIKNLIISGVMTNVCVESTGREAADHGYYCVIAEDSVATWDQHMHDASLRSFSRFFGHVLSTDDVIKVIDASEKSI